MATKPDPNAAKAKKQKFILIGASALFLVLALVQGPKLWKQINPPAAETAAPATPVDAAAVPASNGAATAPAETTAAAPTSSAVTLAAVSVSARPVAGEGQLTSFTLFEVKDPFEQQVEEDDGTASIEPLVSATPDTSAKPGVTGGGSGQGSTGGTTAAPKPPAPTYATIQVNGKASQVQTKGVFPQPQKLFVLVTLKKSKAKIGVKGGSFADGDLVTLTLGKQVTLMDTVTGTRFVVKLVYTGTEPENIESFSSGTAPATTTDGNG